MAVVLVLEGDMLRQSCGYSPESGRNYEENSNFMMR